MSKAFQIKSATFCNPAILFGKLGRHFDRPQLPHLLFDPARFSIRKRIRHRDVRLDVKHGRSVQQVRLIDIKRQPFDFQESHATKTNRIWAIWTAASKSAYAIFALGRYRRARCRTPTFIFMELENHPDAFKAIQITEGCFEIHPRLQHNAARMPSKKAPLSGCIVLVNGITVKCTYRTNLHSRNIDNRGSRQDVGDQTPLRQSL